MPVVQYQHPVDPKDAILKEIGDAPDVEVFGNQVLIATYEIDSNTKTKSGLFLPDKTRDEQLWQGKVGVVIKKGPLAFVNDSNNDFAGKNVEYGDWVFFRVSDGWQLKINGKHCRMLQDVDVRGTVTGPDVVY